MMRKLFILALFALSSKIASAQGIGRFDELESHRVLKNYVKNPSCLKNTAGISASGGTLTRITTGTLVTGGTCQIDASASGQHYTWDTVSFDAKLHGRNCEARFTFNGDASLYKAYVRQGTAQITQDLQLTNQANSREVSINFPCGDGSSATTLRIEATSASAAAVKIAEVYIGEATNIGTVSQAEWVGRVTYAQVPGCAWEVSTVGSFSDFPVDPDCNAPVAVGGVLAPTTKIPAVRLPFVKPGTYFFVATGFFYGNHGAGKYFRFSDGTNFSAQQTTSLHGSIGAGGTVTGNLVYTAGAGETLVRLQGNSEASGSIGIHANVSGRDFSIDVYYFPSQSQQAVRMDQVNTFFGIIISAASDVNTNAAASSFAIAQNANLIASPLSFSGPVGIACAGTTPSVVGQYTCSGGDEAFGIIASINSPGIYEVCMSPSFGVQSATDSGAIWKISLTQNNSNTIVVDDTSGETAKSYRAHTAHGTITGCSQFNITSVGDYTFKLFFREYGLGLHIRAGPNYRSQITIRRILPQQQAPLLVGGVTSSYAGVAKIHYLTFGGSGFNQFSSPVACTSSPCTIGTNSGFVSSVTRSGTGNYTVNFSPVFTKPIMCFATSLSNGESCYAKDGTGTTTINVYCGVRTIANYDAAVSLMCIESL